jgi:hypothetical protein
MGEKVAPEGRPSATFRQLTRKSRRFLTATPHRTTVRRPAPDGYTAPNHGAAAGARARLRRRCAFHLLSPRFVGRRGPTMMEGCPTRPRRPGRRVSGLPPRRRLPPGLPLPTRLPVEAGPTGRPPTALRLALRPLRPLRPALRLALRLGLPSARRPARLDGSRRRARPRPRGRPDRGRRRQVHRPGGAPAPAESGRGRRRPRTAGACLSAPTRSSSACAPPSPPAASWPPRRSATRASGCSVSSPSDG